MHFQPFYLGCLAHASYLVGDGGEAVIIDPQRDVDQYLAEAASRGLVIRHVVETHLHADFVSGHLELAARTGAAIWLGPGSGASFAHRVARDGDEIRVGGLVLRFLETPGHTPESISVLLLDGATAAPQKVFTGDALFVGDVGRPDLVASRGFSPAEMASMLYNSLHDKLLALPDEVEVWPAHGAGSLCGRAIGAERSTTIGVQRRSNWALADMSREQFIEQVTSALPPAPAYFQHDAALNRLGAQPLADLAPPVRLAPAEVAAGGTLVLDVRDASAWAAGHVPGSLNIGLRGAFASWAGTLVPVDAPIVLVAADRDGEHEARMRLARVGIERVVGTLLIDDWRDAGLPLASVPQLEARELARLARSSGIAVIDVRRPAEYAAAHIPGAVNLPVDELGARLGELDPARPVAVACAGGYRSAAAAGILERAGFTVAADLAGGTTAWLAAGLPVERAGAAEAA
ncbi:MAG TPA: rhodanese-like domain-containing protein [Kofleriaceae bacterium]|nr:rhodanese-like domain-containing protein [Kofleriaceae bacterium]